MTLAALAISCQSFPILSQNIDYVYLCYGVKGNDSFAFRTFFFMAIVDLIIYYSSLKDYKWTNLA